MTGSSRRNRIAVLSQLTVLLTGLDAVTPRSIRASVSEGASPPLPESTTGPRRLNEGGVIGDCPLSNTDVFIPIAGVEHRSPEVLNELITSIEVHVPCYHDLVLVSDVELSQLGVEVPSHAKTFVLQQPQEVGAVGEHATTENMIMVADKFTSSEHVFVMEPGTVFTGWEDGCFFNEAGKSHVYCSSLDDEEVDGSWKDGTEYMLSRTVTHDCSHSGPVVYPRDAFLETRMWVESMHDKPFERILAQDTEGVSIAGVQLVKKKPISPRDVINHYMLKFMDRVSVSVDRSNLRWNLKDTCTKVSDLITTTTSAPVAIEVAQPSTPIIPQCPQIDYAGLQAVCPFRDIDCVTLHLWDQRPLPYLPTNEDVTLIKNDYWLDRGRAAINKHGERGETPSGEAAYKLELDYHAIGDDLSASGEGWRGNPPAVDQHRTFVLTQPKVGTGSLWYGSMPMSDFMVRSHDVIGMLKSEIPPLPLPGCRAKPEQGTCSIMLGIRDPLTWLRSMYFELNGNQDCAMSPEDPVIDWYDWMQTSIDVKHSLPMGWWKASEQLRTLGVTEEKIIEIFQDMVKNFGVRVLWSYELPGLPAWMEGCNVVLVQMEKMRSGSDAERIIRENISPKFRFRTNDEVVSRADLCPALTDAIKQVKQAPLPQRILREYRRINPDFGVMWDIYHGTN